jgi:hypothetical protein
MSEYFVVNFNERATLFIQQLSKLDLLKGDVS